MAGEGSSTAWTGAFLKPDPLDPNDRKRQRTIGRAPEYPYDEPLSYGAPVGTDLGGAAYQRTRDVQPPVPRNKRPSDVIPYGQLGVAWEQLESMLATYEPGEQAYDAPRLGYGNHGRMGDGYDPEELDLDALRQEFRDTFVETQPEAEALGAKGLFSLLALLDPEYAAELFAPDGDDEMAAIYGDWGRHVYAPGAEHDEEPPDEDYPE